MSGLRPRPTVTEWRGIQLKDRMYVARDGRRQDDGHVDEVAVRRRLRGDTSVTLTVREFVVAVIDGARAGRTDNEIAEALGATQDAVMHCRKRHGVESPRWRFAA